MSGLKSRDDRSQDDTLSMIVNIESQEGETDKEVKDDGKDDREKRQ